jgi:hypothetical protein
LLGNLFIHTWSDASVIAIWLALMLTLLRAKNSSHHDFRAIIFAPNKVKALQTLPPDKTAMVRQRFYPLACGGNS